MNLLFVIHSPRNDKTAIYTGYRNKKKAYEKHGWKVDILSPQDFALSSKASRFMPLVYPFQVARWLYKTDIPFDLVIFHSYSGWVFHLIKKSILRHHSPFKTAIAFHGVEELFFRAMEEEGHYSGKPLSLRFRFFYCFLLVKFIKMSCQKSDRIFCLNTREKTFLAEANYQKPENIVILPNDIQSIFFSPRTYKANAETLLFVGQWLPMKGIHYLSKAFAQLSELYPQLKLILAGTLKGSDSVLADFPKHLHSSIQVIAEIPHEEMPAIYKKADIFILPSLFEAFNRALVEAMASGLPAISTPVGVVDDCFTDEIHYLKIPYRNSEAIVKSVISLISDTGRREKLGGNAALVVRKYEEDAAQESCFEGNFALMKEPFE